jgi:hypothetical protein
MPVADPVAIISVVSGAAVAITVPLITSAVERRRLREQVGGARLDELRSVFDEAAVALDRALRALPTWEVVAQTEPDDVAAYAESRKAVEVVGTQAERIAVRLGESSAAFAGYDRARQRLIHLHHLVIADTAMRKLPDRVDPTPVPDPEADIDFTEGRRQFRQAASDIVGPDLPSRARGANAG